jgi:diacylglycerol O-acyltransferase-1
MCSVACCAAQASLVPAFILTVVAIVLSMKLATYAHCNTTLRTEARARAVAAAAANYPVPSTPLQPASYSGIGSGTGSGLWSRAKAGLATAATHTPAAGGGGVGYASGDSSAPALRSSATDPHPFLMAGLRRTNSTLRRQAAAGVVVVRDVVYPGNLVPSDLAYFLAAPTLTYQLNFPRLRQRRWRLLSRWLLLAVLTAIAMSFMQVGGLACCVICAFFEGRTIALGWVASSLREQCLLVAL